jgi:hypothetical protein
MRPPPEPDRRRARIACPCRDGFTEVMMLAHGFTIEQICELLDGGLTMASLVGRPLRRAKRMILDFQCQNTVMSDLT